ncbi:MAG TPA: hypothetical protein VFW07_27005 [Parafilimonas sp.]|nr:hypothetical protein [Parafilimonas sp.]
MAINKNHEFEELNGTKCAIVEKNVTKERADFLKQVLGYNHYTVVVIPTPPPPAKAVPQGGAKPAPAAGAAIAETVQAVPIPPAEPQPETFTVGVTDVTFNSINAIFGRLLKAPGGHVVTLAYWQQKETTSHDEIPYFYPRN